MVAAQPLEQHIVVLPADRRAAVVVVIVGLKVVGHDGPLRRRSQSGHAAPMKRTGGLYRDQGRRPLPRRQREEVAHFLG